jgi:hypothetical protein
LGSALSKPAGLKTVERRRDANVVSAYPSKLQMDKEIRHLTLALHTLRYGVGSG